MPRPPKRRFICPECDREFLRGPGLGSHRRTVHGIMGMAPSTIAMREAKEAAKSAKEAAKSGLVCSECKREFSNKRELGLHRWYEHKISGKWNKSERRSKTLTPTDTPIQCPDCSYLARNTNGLGKHRAKMHGVHGVNYKPKASNGKMLQFFNSVTKNTNGDASHNGNEEERYSHGIALGLAIGRIEAVISNIAGAHGVSASELTSGIVEVFRSKALR